MQPLISRFSEPAQLKTGESYKRFLSSDRIANWHIFVSVHFALDITALLAAWYAAIQLRVYLNPWTAAQISANHLRLLAPDPLLLVVLWTAATLWVGLYRRKPVWSAAHAIRQAFESDVIACALAIAATFFSSHVNDFSRSFVVLFGPMSLFLLIVSFYLAVLITHRLQRTWVKPRRVALFGEGDELNSFVRNLERSGKASLRVTGVIVPERSAAGSHAARGFSVPVLGTVRQLAEVINRERLDQLICMSGVSPSDFEFCGAVSNRMGVTLSQSLATAVSHKVRYELNSECGLDLLNAEPLPFSHRQELLKRALDIAAAALLIALLSPLLITLILLIRLTSTGPAFYKSPRVGRGGRHFMFWKFRSMYVNGPRRDDLRARNERNGHIFKMRNDPRITPLGRVMRRYSLDELPQLINVLMGQMSLVGPRPLPAEDLDPDGLSREHSTWAELRVQVRPGITGIWQIRGRSDLSFEDMVQFDLEYIRDWSLALDVRLLLETPLAVLSGRGAY